MTVVHRDYGLSVAGRYEIRWYTLSECLSNKTTIFCTQTKGGDARRRDSGVVQMGTLLRRQLTTPAVQVSKVDTLSCQCQRTCHNFIQLSAVDSIIHNWSALVDRGKASVWTTYNVEFPLPHCSVSFCRTNFRHSTVVVFAVIVVVIFCLTVPFSWYIWRDGGGALATSLRP